MTQFTCRPAARSLPATLMILGMVLLLAACGSNGGNETAMMGPGDMPGNNGGPMTELGEWNTLMPGSLDITDANGVLRANYDASGDGHVMAAAPVQPVGTGTATWNGMWSGKIEVNPDPLVTVVLELFDSSPDALARLGGGAQVTAYFENGDVEVALTYRDIGVPELGISEITSDRVPVTDGLFEPTKMQTAPFAIEVQGRPYSGEFTGDFTGEGAFGGTDAAGVVGYVDGDIAVDYGQGLTNFGAFQSVFYGTKDEN